ncbi:MAG: FAD/NAD(P)-binding protein [Rickettsiales bacterium]
MNPPRIAVIGFGFSGLMVVANLVREAKGALLIYIIDPALDARGVAYSTTCPQHLLNVSASRMGAYAHDIGGFYDWLQTPEGMASSQRVCGRSSFASRDFAPRMLYGAYLDSIWRTTQELAATKSIQLKLLPTRASTIAPTPLAVLTERGDAVAVDTVVLAVGHEFKPIFPQLAAELVIQHPWAPGALAGAAKWASPVMLLGSGLTAIDMLLMLREKGYSGEVVAVSRTGTLPQPHRHDVTPYALDVEALLQQKTLSKMLRSMRAAFLSHGEWRGVLDSLRPHTRALWQSLSVRDQQRFQRRLGTRWSTHRHRMAPEIAMRVETERVAGTFRVVAAKRVGAQMQAGRAEAKLCEEMLHPSRIIHCVGPELNVTRSARNVLKQALADGLIEPHSNGVGITTDPHGRVVGAAYPNLYAVGSLMTGQWLESTAVPELRAQAAGVAQTILKIAASA